MIHKKGLGILGVTWVAMALVSCADVEKVPISSVELDSRICAVDLGLSVMWGDRNLEAESTENSGLTCGWGDPTGTMKGDNDLAFGGPDAPQEISGTELDIVHVRLGGKWRLPTKAEVQELIDYCSWDRTYNYNNTYVSGYFIYGRNGNRLFMRNDYYWTGTLSDTDNEKACVLDLNNSSDPEILSYNRSRHLYIRPVCDY